MKYTLENLLVVDYIEVRKLLQEVFKHNFDIPCLMGWNNYSWYRINIPEDCENDEFDEIVEAAYKGKFEEIEGQLATLLTYCFNIGKCDEGKYLIQVSW